MQIALTPVILLVIAGIYCLFKSDWHAKREAKAKLDEINREIRG